MTTTTLQQRRVDHVEPGVNMDFQQPRARKRNSDPRRGPAQRRGAMQERARDVRRSAWENDQTPLKRHSAPTPAQHPEHVGMKDLRRKWSAPAATQRDPSPRKNHQRKSYTKNVVMEHNGPAYAMPAYDHDNYDYPLDDCSAKQRLSRPAPQKPLVPPPRSSRGSQELESNYQLSSHGNGSFAEPEPEQDYVPNSSSRQSSSSGPQFEPPKYVTPSAPRPKRKRSLLALMFKRRQFDPEEMSHITEEPAHYGYPGSRAGSRRQSRAGPDYPGAIKEYPSGDPYNSAIGGSYPGHPSYPTGNPKPVPIQAGDGVIVKDMPKQSFFGRLFGAKPDVSCMMTHPTLAHATARNNMGPARQVEFKFSLTSMNIKKNAIAPKLWQRIVFFQRTGTRHDLSLEIKMPEVEPFSTGIVSATLGLSSNKKQFNVSWVTDPEGVWALTNIREGRALIRAFIHPTGDPFNRVELGIGAFDFTGDHIFSDALAVPLLSMEHGRSVGMVKLDLLDFGRIERDLPNQQNLTTISEDEVMKEADEMTDIYPNDSVSQIGTKKRPRARTTNDMYRSLVVSANCKKWESRHRDRAGSMASKRGAGSDTSSPPESSDSAPFTQDHLESFKKQHEQQQKAAKKKEQQKKSSFILPGQSLSQSERDAYQKQALAHHLPSKRPVPRQSQPTPSRSTPAKSNSLTHASSSTADTKDRSSQQAGSQHADSQNSSRVDDSAAPPRVSITRASSPPHHDSSTSSSSSDSSYQANSRPLPAWNSDRGNESKKKVAAVSFPKLPHPAIQHPRSPTSPPPSRPVDDVRDRPRTQDFSQDVFEASDRRNSAPAVPGAGRRWSEPVGDTRVSHSTLPSLSPSSIGNEQTRESLLMSDFLSHKSSDRTLDISDSRSGRSSRVRSSSHVSYNSRSGTTSQRLSEPASTNRNRSRSRSANGRVSGSSTRSLNFSRSSLESLENRSLSPPPPQMPKSRKPHIPDLS